VTTDSFLIILISFSASRCVASVFTRILKLDVHLSQHCKARRETEKR
jgi:hypothetical protein